jgi:hypothetical protein
MCARRFMICFNPEQADRDAALREVMTGKLGAMIADTDRLTRRNGRSCAGGSPPCPG